MYILIFKAYTRKAILCEKASNSKGYELAMKSHFHEPFRHMLAHSVTS